MNECKFVHVLHVYTYVGFSFRLYILLEDDSQPAVLSAFGFAIQQDLFSNDDDQSDSDGEWEEQKVTDSDHKSVFMIFFCSFYLHASVYCIVLRMVSITFCVTWKKIRYC